MWVPGMCGKRILCPLLFKMLAPPYDIFHQADDGDGNFTNCENFPVPVAAWHPLPEPYKENEEVEG